jgi:hypothetical protein
VRNKLRHWVTCMRRGLNEGECVPCPGCVTGQVREGCGTANASWDTGTCQNCGDCESKEYRDGCVYMSEVRAEFACPDLYASMLCFIEAQNEMCPYCILKHVCILKNVCVYVCMCVCIHVCVCVCCSKHLLNLQGECKACRDCGPELFLRSKFSYQ